MASTLGRHERENLLRVGGVAGYIFATVWVVCGVGYVIIAGIPSEPASIDDTVALMRQPPYRLLFWIWPIAYLAVIPFALAARVYIRSESRVLADLGTAFVLLYAGLWFVHFASVTVGLSIANADPVDETLLRFAFLLTTAIGPSLFWSIALFEIFWGLALVKGADSHRLLGRVLLIGAALSLIYFVMRSTGPMFVAELVHEGLILFMVVGVAGLARNMLKDSRSGP